MSRSTSSARSRSSRTPPRTPKPKRSKTHHKGKGKGKVVETVRNDGTGTSQSKAIIGKKHKKHSILSKVLKWETPIQLSENLAQQVTNAPVGTQACGVLNPILTGTDIQNMYNVTDNVKPSLLLASYLPKYIDGQKSFKIFIDYAQMIATFSNVTTANITLDIYDVAVKRDRSAPNADQPKRDWDNGQYFDEAGSQAVTATSTAPFTDPTNSILFKQNYTIVRKCHVELAQGRSHEHIHFHKLDKMVNTEVTATNTHIKGLTTFIMYVVRGLPAIETATGTATLALAKVACVTRLKFKYRILSVMPTVFKEAGVLISSAVNLVSEGAGSVGAEAAA